MDFGFTRPGFNAAAGSFTPDGLIAGDFDVITKSVLLKAGTAYQRGHVLQPLTAGDAGKYGAVTADASAQYILLEDRDATAGDLYGVVAVTGEYNANKLILGAGATLAGVRATLETHTIYIRDAVAG